MNSTQFSGYEYTLTETDVRSRTRIAFLAAKKALYSVRRIEDVIKKTNQIHKKSQKEIKAETKQLYNQSIRLTSTVNTSVGKVYDSRLPLYERAAEALDYIISKYELNEIEALGHVFSDDKIRFAEYHSFGDEYIDGAKKSASGIINNIVEAREKIEEPTHDDIIFCKNATNLLNTISFDADKAKKLPPKKLERAIIDAEEEVLENENKKLKAEESNQLLHHERPDVLDLLENCAEMITTMRTINASKSTMMKRPAR